MPDAAHDPRTSPVVPFGLSLVDVHLAATAGGWQATYDTDACVVLRHPAGPVLHAVIDHGRVVRAERHHPDPSPLPLPGLLAHLAHLQPLAAADGPGPDPVPQAPLRPEPRRWRWRRG